MKKLFAIAFIATATLVACNNDGEKKETADTTAAPKMDTAAAPKMDTTAAPKMDTAAAPKMDTTAK
jgi:uncharacterized protein involved in copper resistance